MNNNFWTIKQAELIIKKLRPNQETVIFETGYGPSGLPHLGTFAELVRTSYIISALKEIRPELKIKLIVFSDDRDGLRKIPPNFPNKEMLQKNLGKPLSLIPDPFEEKETFASYMNSKLQEFLNIFGFEYEYISATDFYISGKMDQTLRKITDNYQQIRNLFIASISPDKRAAWSPFFVVCPKCHKVYSTQINDIDYNNYKIDFSCNIDSENFKSCGYKGIVDIKGTNLKLGWKVDWAARWHALKVDFEPHGEDLTESVRISKKICRILGSEGPLTFKYELFLDDQGNKISKTKGNGLSMEQWLKYSPLPALLYFLASDPNKSKKMGKNILPQLVDEYLNTEKKSANPILSEPLWYVKKLNKKPLQEVQNFISYRLLSNLIDSTKIESVDLLIDYVKKYDNKLPDNPDFAKYCQQVIDFVKDLQQPAEDLQPDLTFMPYLHLWYDYLQGLKNNSLDAQSAQQQLFAIARQGDLKQKSWFKFLYNIYFNKNEGPKLGEFFAILGLETTINLTKQILEKNG